MLKKKRMELGLSRLQLARKTGVPTRYIDDFEQGIWEGRERELALVNAFLRLPTREIPERFLTPQESQRSWLVAEQACLDFELPLPPQEFRERVPCTLLQALAWCRLLKAGAVLGEASPVEFGFWSHGLVDQYHNPLGVRALPLLTWDDAEWRYIIWPQLRARSQRRTYRLDALTLTAGWRQSRWAVMQLDGRQNRWDRALGDNLKLPLVVPDPTEVHRPGWRRHLQSLLIPPEQSGQLSAYDLRHSALLPMSEFGLVDGQATAGELFGSPPGPGGDFEAGFLD